MHIEIQSLDDERLAPYRNVRDRDLLRERLFIAESRVVLEVLLKRSAQRQAVHDATPIWGVGGTSRGGRRPSLPCHQQQPTLPSLR